MDYYAVELVCEGQFQIIGILLYPIHANEDITLKFSLHIAVVEGDDIGISLMVEVLYVDLQKIFIRTKDEVQLPELSLLLFDCGLDPGGGFTGLGKLEGI